MWRECNRTITVTPNNTASAASTTPTLCISTVITDITHATTGATGIGTATGLPAGVTQHLLRIPLQLVVHQLYREHQLYYSTDRWMWRCECNRNDYSNTKQPASAAKYNTNIVYQYCINRYYPCNNWSNGNRTATGLPAELPQHLLHTITISGTPTVWEHSTIFH
jgi:hypothetical protein